MIVLLITRWLAFELLRIGMFSGDIDVNIIALGPQNKFVSGNLAEAWREVHCWWDSMGPSLRCLPWTVSFSSGMPWVSIWFNVNVLTCTTSKYSNEVTYGSDLLLDLNANLVLVVNSASHITPTSNLFKCSKWCAWLSCLSALMFWKNTTCSLHAQWCSNKTIWLRFHVFRNGQSKDVEKSEFSGLQWRMIWKVQVWGSCCHADGNTTMRPLICT